MSATPRLPRDLFDNPAIYRIRVLGWIREDWSERLGGMTIEVVKSEGGSPVTTLTGELRDQAALAGVLETLYSLHLPMLSLEQLPVGAAHSDD